MSKWLIMGFVAILALMSLGRPSTHTVQAAYGGLSPQASGITTNLRAIACPATTICYAVGDQGHILATTDGGRTWRLQRNPLSGLSDLNAITCPAIRICYVAGGYMVAAAGPSGYFPPAEGAILATFDGGRTWRQQRSHLGYTRLTGIACTGVSHCVIVADAGRTLQTTDSGRTWRAAEAVTRNELFAVTCPSARSCAAVGYAGTTVATADGGATWTSGRAVTLQDLHGIACPDAHSCVAVGSGGTILRSSNAGLSWTQATTPFSAYVKPTLNSVTCPSARVCYAAGLGNYRSAFVGTMDGGKTWTDLGANTTAMLTGVSCPAASTCYAVGAQGAVVKTTAANPGTGSAGSSTGGSSTGGQTGAAGGITLDKVVISLTPDGPQTYILHKQSTAYFTAYYHAAASGASGTVTLLEGGRALGTYPLAAGTAPDGSPTLSAAISMATFPPESIVAQFTVHQGSATETQTVSSLLLAD